MASPLSPTLTCLSGDLLEIDTSVCHSVPLMGINAVGMNDMTPSNLTNVQTEQGCSNLNHGCILSGVEDNTRWMAKTEIPPSSSSNKDTR